MEQISMDFEILQLINKTANIEISTKKSELQTDVLLFLLKSYPLLI